jgi:hypothetical protein
LRVAPLETAVFFLSELISGASSGAVAALGAKVKRQLMTDGGQFAVKIWL